MLKPEMPARRYFMITLFNRKELIVTLSMEVQAQVRSKLQEQGIDYSIKTINRKSPSAFSDTRARTGTFCENLAVEYEYVIYVKKEDYDRAAAVVHGSLSR